MGLCLPDGRWAHHRDRGWVCLVRPDGILSWGIEMSEERGRGGGEPAEIFQIEIQGDGGLAGG